MAHAQGTHLWSASTFADWEKGTPTAVAIGSDGTLTPGPPLTTVAQLGTADLWAVASDSSGNAYVATGSPAQVVKVAPDGRQTVLFTSKDVSVQTLAVGPDGALYAATLPSAKVYRIDTTRPSGAKPLDETTAPVVFDAANTAEKPHYIWSIRFDSSKRMLLATGGPGAIYRVAQPGAAAPAKPELFFQSDEPHIRTIEFAPNGDLLAGSDGTGLVYRISPAGKAFVQFEAQKREITALAFGPKGQLYVAAVGEKGRLAGVAPLPVGTGAGATASITVTVVQPGSAQSVSNNAAIPDGSELYLLPADPKQAPRTLVAAHDEIIYALHDTPQGLLLATGNHGHIYRMHDDGTFADIGHADAGQVIGFAKASDGALYAATANTGKLLLLGKEADAASSKNATAQSTLLSEVFDATQPSLWGRAEVTAESPDNTYVLEARTGNIDNPVRGWGDWKVVDPHIAQDLPFANGARFAQWRLRLKPGAQLERVALNYLPANSAPIVDEVLVVPGTRVNAQAVQPTYPQPTTINFNSQGGAAINLDANSPAVALSAIRDKSSITARWAAHDDNGDELRFALYYRSEGSTADPAWHLLKDNLTDRYYSFDATLLPDGPYRLRVVASDAPSNSAADTLTAERVSDLFVVDTETPAVPTLTASRQAEGLRIQATAADAHTPIARAEYSLDAGPWQLVLPVSGISDATQESYSFLAPLPHGSLGSHVVTLRVFDRYDNEGSAKVAIP